MNASRVVPILRYLRRLTRDRESMPSDSELLERYLDRRDQAAFADLVERHGAMVLGVCRSVLRHHQDAEDAFQAAFLVLSSKAGSIRRRESLASWLHGVAHRVALQARAKNMRRQALEAKAKSPAADNSADDITWGELREILHAELAGMPERYRAPLVLCYLEGLTQDEAARRLCWSATTLKGRLQRGRNLLRNRLLRRGLALTTALAAVLAEQTLASSVPPALALATARAAIQSATAITAASVLAGNTLRQMAPLRWKAVSALLLAVGILAGGVGFLPPQLVGKKPEENGTQQQWQARTDPQGDPLPAGAVARLGILRFNHGDRLDNLRFTPDGKTILSTGGGILRVWDTATGKELGQFSRKVPSWDDQIVLPPDGKTLISLGQESKDTLRFWDLTQHKEVRVVPLPVQRSLISVHFRNALSPDGRLALINLTGQIRVFDIATAKELWRLDRAEGEAHPAIFAGGDHVVTVDKKHSIEVWEARTGKSIRKFAQVAPAEILAASPDGNWLATLEHHVGAIDRYLDKDVIHVWDLTTGTERHQLASRQKRWYMSLLFSPDSKQLLSYCTGEVDSELTIWDAQSGKRLHELRDVIGQHMSLSPDGSRLAAGNNWGKFKLFDMKTLKQISVGVGHDLPTTAVSLSPRGDRALTASYGWISTWDIATSHRLHSIAIPKGWHIDPYVILWPNSPYAISLTRQSQVDETQILIWDVAAGKCLHTLRLRGPETHLATAFSPDSSMLAIWQSGEQAVVRLWDVRTGKEVGSFKESKAGWPQQLFFTPDGKSLFVAGKRTVGYDVTSGKEMFSWRMEPLPAIGGVARKGGGAPVQPEERRAWRRLVVSPEGTLAACVLDNEFHRPDRSPDRLVLCDARTGRVIRRWSDSGVPSSDYEELAFSHDGRLLASSDCQVVHLWEVATGMELRTFRGHRGEIRSLGFSADGRRLASASTDSTVLIWDLVPAHADGSDTVASWWADLASDDARRAYAAIWRLSETPEPALALLRQHLRPVPEPDASKIRQCIEDLDSKGFAVRQKASKELEALGDAALPALRETLDKNPSLEVRRRLETLLSRPPVSVTSSELRNLRALNVLELIDSANAHRLLAELGAGATYAAQTQEARAALRRLSPGTMP
ncbi:MAG TPA: sigma-70 family RNA polymerase sigma factor [Gemmataceae bacterium]|nr:sigma-70 family RNA polymerase sigma factor [Gemmataceae bacterium]